MKKLKLIFLLLLSACGNNGPLVTSCISNPKENNFNCYSEAAKKNLVKTIPDVDNWVFVSSADELSFLNSCAAHQGYVKVNVCIFNAGEIAFHCYDEVKNEADGMTFRQSQNYVGLSGEDEEALLNYCASLKN